MRRLLSVLWVAACMAALPVLAVTNNSPIPGAPVVFRALPPHPAYGTRVDFSTSQSPDGTANVFSQSYVMDPYQRPYMGLQIRDLGGQLASYFSVEGGVLVESVDTNGPAHEAEIRAGDVIVSFQDGPVGSIDDLFRELDDMRSGDRIALDIVRRGNPLAVNLTLIDRPGPPHHFSVPEDVKNMLGKVNVIFGDRQSEHLSDLIETMRKHVPSLRMPDAEVRRIADEQVRKEIEQLRGELDKLRNDVKTERGATVPPVDETGTGAAE
jgi:hypothetical protein